MQHAIATLSDALYKLVIGVQDFLTPGSLTDVVKTGTEKKKCHYESLSPPLLSCCCLIFCQAFLVVILLRHIKPTYTNWYTLAQ